MIVYNTNPKGSGPIMIITYWRPNPDPRYPAIWDTTYSIAPGEGIDLDILGLRPKTKKPRTKKVKK